MFVKFCRVKKACVGDEGERERALDDVFGYYMYHVAKSEFRQNFAKFAKILSLSQKYSKTNSAKF